MSENLEIPFDKTLSFKNLGRKIKVFRNHTLMIGIVQAETDEKLYVKWDKDDHPKGEIMKSEEYELDRCYRN